MKVYSIYDVKAEAYGNLFNVTSDGLAVRIFTQLVAMGSRPEYQQFPEDFALYFVGEFDEQSGKLSSETSKMVMTATAALQSVRGAAVGGETPLKQQSASNSVSEADAEKSSPACETSETVSSKAQNEDKENA